MLPAHVRWILAIIIAAPLLLVANSILTAKELVSPVTSSLTSNFCLASLSLCSAVMILSRNPAPRQVSEIR